MSEHKEFNGRKYFIDKCKKEQREIKKGR